MLWFGSSAGVALSNLFPEARDARRWLVGGWHVVLGYVIGFATLLFVMGWHPDPLGESPAASIAPPASVVK